MVEEENSSDEMVDETRLVKIVFVGLDGLGVNHWSSSVGESMEKPIVRVG